LKRFTEHTFANLTYEIVKVLDENRVENYDPNIYNLKQGN